MQRRLLLTIKLFPKGMVRAKGLEPSRVAPLEPKSSVSANSTTPACVHTQLMNNSKRFAYTPPSIIHFTCLVSECPCYGHFMKRARLPRCSAEPRCVPRGTFLFRKGVSPAAHFCSERDTPQWHISVPKGTRPNGTLMCQRGVSPTEQSLCASPTRSWASRGQSRRRG